jgi:hypothetical protein
VRGCARKRAHAGPPHPRPQENQPGRQSRNNGLLATRRRPGSLRPRRWRRRPRSSVRPGEVISSRRTSSRCSTGIACSAGYATSPRVDWASLLRRSFSVDVLECPKCHGRLRVVAAITEREPVATHPFASGHADRGSAPVACAGPDRRARRRPGLGTARPRLRLSRAPPPRSRRGARAAGPPLAQRWASASRTRRACSGSAPGSPSPRGGEDVAARIACDAERVPRRSDSGCDLRFSGFLARAPAGARST